MMNTQGPFLKMNNRFRMLISKMLHPNPTKRISAHEAVDLINSWTPGPKRPVQLAADRMLEDGVCVDCPYLCCHYVRTLECWWLHEALLKPGHDMLNNYLSLADAGRREKKACHGLMIPPPLSPFPNVTSCEFEWLASTNIPDAVETDAPAAVGLVELRPEHLNHSMA